MCCLQDFMMPITIARRVRALIKKDFDDVFQSGADAI